MQHDSNLQTAEAEIPEYLRCDPRTFRVKLDSEHDRTCKLEFTIVIKCTDEQLHEHNNYWAVHKIRLNHNNGDIVAVILKMIGTNVFGWCCENNTNSLHPEYGVNSMFNQKGWNTRCFEITNLSFENEVNDEAFEFELVKIEGMKS